MYYTDELTRIAHLITARVLHVRSTDDLMRESDGSVRVGLGSGVAGPLMLLRNADLADHVDLLELTRTALGSYGASDVSLFGGWTGILASLDEAFASGNAFAHFRVHLRSQLRSHMPGLLRAVGRASMSSGAWFDSCLAYDIVGGVAGLLLAAQHLSLHTDESLAAADDFFLSIARADCGKAFRCSTPGLAAVDGPTLNLGVAHGLPGLALAIAACPDTEHRVAALSSIAVTLLDVGAEVDGPWPCYRLADGTFAPNRVGWCYGAPGASVAMDVVGELTGSQDLRDLALRSAVDAVRRPEESSGLFDSTLCHGHASMALMLHMLLARTGSAELASPLEGAVARLVSEFSENEQYGYVTQLADGPVRRPDFLIGATGLVATCEALTGAWTSWTWVLGCPSDRFLAAANANHLSSGTDHDVLRP